MGKPRKEKISFIVTKIVSKPATINFYTKSGKEVKFKGHKDVPKSVKIEFLAKKKK